MTRTPTDDTLDLIVDICRIGAQPGGSQLLDTLFPGTQEAVRKAAVDAMTTGSGSYTMTASGVSGAEPDQDELQDRPIVIRTCPVCRMPHPADQACKPGEAADNGYKLTHRS